jgi:error-prone DNA polymerase
MNPKELTILANIGALNELSQHRRDALWQTQRAGRPEGPLLIARGTSYPSVSLNRTPLKRMTTSERMVADFAGTGLTIGIHPMARRRKELHRDRVLSATDLRNVQDGTNVRIAGCVIARQRPGTAMGFIFLSMEDETGIANVIVAPALYEKARSIVTRSRFILAEGPLQNQEGVIHVKACGLTALSEDMLEIRSHDCH